MTVVRDLNGDGHAVLTIKTTRGDYILDNRRNDILRWSDVAYRFLKRQSAQDPLHWVALTKEVPISDGNIAGGGHGK